MRFPKEKTARDAKYLAWLRRLPCAFCGAPAPSEASHHGKRGVGLKASDHEALPACRRCHQRHHDKGSAHARFDGMDREQRSDALGELAGRYRSMFLRASGS